jgi:uncharacterized protein
MTAPTLDQTSSDRTTNRLLDAAIAGACARIAPTWPLDRMIAVNPYWGFVGQPIEEAAAELAAHSGATLLMPRNWFREQWRAGRFAVRHLETACALAPHHQPEALRRTARDLVAALDRPARTPTARALVTDVADIGRDLAHGMPWGEFVTRHISQACAAYFDEGQAQWGPAHDGGLWLCWRDLAVHDGSPRLLMALRGFRDAAAALPTDPRALIAEAVRALQVEPETQQDYFTALLLSVNGWASACAFRRWEARLANGDDHQIEQLLAVRLAWELLLIRLDPRPTLPAAWQQAQRAWGGALPAAARAQHDDWLLQRALEVAYQDDVALRLSTAPISATPPPTAQAVFCIDVRSEVFRRALESAAPSVQTLGFAGFFGLPVAYAPVSGPVRAQLPGLLAASMHVADIDQQQRTRVTADHASGSWSSGLTELGSLAGSAFSFVESAGLGWAGALVRDGFTRREHTGDVLREGVRARPRVVPEIATFAANGTAVDLDTRVALATGVLRAMSLTRGFAPIVALIGHGASTENNPQAAGLHCGACGGQTGEVNARALAALLNSTDVRAGLLANGIDVADTRFVGGLHDTTTDDVHLFDGDIGSNSVLDPTHHRDALADFRTQLAYAGRGARRERAAALGLGALADAALEDAIRARAADWSEVRPEWGLAGNACFIVAPRTLTRGVDLAGRSFLHDYRWQDDRDYAVLELIMTAPMVVTHWINMQYHASTVDPLRYGSGNKVLHNVVGGHLGVMEGAGGDLRIGLAWQSVHDGTRERHEPLRLSVFIDAPADAIDGIITKHAVVRDLVHHGWLFLHRLDGERGAVWRRLPTGWAPVDPGTDATPRP